MRSFWALSVVALLASCHQAPPRAAVHYTVGPAYQVGGAWRYPRANFSYDATGIAAIEHAPANSLTADGEIYSSNAFAAAHPTLELPAIARITNLENGRQVVVRINNRGPADPGRIIAVTPVAAQALGFGAEGVARVRVAVLAAPSEDLALALPGGPRVDVARAPVGAVEVTNLAPPGGGATERPPPALRHVEARATTTTLPHDLPGARSMVAPRPGAIWIRAGLFTEDLYADLEARSLARFGARIVPWRGGGSFQDEVRIGPFQSVARADTVLKEVLAAGFGGARLVVE